MDERTLDRILAAHGRWLDGEEDGEKANLAGADLHLASLAGANLTGADLTEANLSCAYLYGANLSGADLTEATLIGANLSRADLSEANLSWANLSRANLRRADLNGANPSRANLGGTNLNGANLSGAQGLLNARDWLAEHFERTDEGIVVYKAIGATEYQIPGFWRIEPGAYLTETVNPLPTVECACGVNFGTREWVELFYPNATIWRCLIEWMDLATVVVPYNTDGKARCGRLRLLEAVRDARECGEGREAVPGEAGRE